MRRTWRSRRVSRPDLRPLTAERGAVAERDATTLCAIPLRDSEDRILSLDGLLGIVAGRVPLLIEVKSTWSDDHTYERNIAAAVARPIRAMWR